MALNLLPLLIVGGAAAYVVTSDKKKKEEAKVCPPATTITLGELSSVNLQATEKFGHIADPSQEASFLVNELLPKGCSKASKDSTFKISILEMEKSWEISISDAYMLLFANGIGSRIQDNKLTEDQGKELWARELGWYKKLTGKNFDPSESAMELAKLVAEAIFGDAVKPDDKPDDKPAESTCPANFEWNFDEAEVEKLAMALEAGRQQHPTDPFKIADVMFASSVIPGCSKKDFSSTVTMNLAVDNAPLSSRTMDLAALYAMFVIEAADRLNLSPMQIEVIEKKVASNYLQLTGKALSL